MPFGHSLTPGYRLSPRWAFETKTRLDRPHEPIAIAPEDLDAASGSVKLAAKAPDEDRGEWEAAGVFGFEAAAGAASMRRLAL